MLRMRKKNRNLDNPGQLITPAGLTNPPKQHEVDAAEILALHYRTTVEFIRPIDDYKRKSPDIKMLGVEWEIKTPKGKSKSTIGTQFSRASKQSGNIIIDTRHTKLKYERIETTVKLEMSKRHEVKKVILIRKPKIIVEFFK